jgi:hypothetical protein
MNQQSYPFYAQYGYVDGPNIGHQLIYFDGDKSTLPSELLGLTDAPPSATEQWWPSVGCAPLKSWFVLWWSVPDQNQQRNGTVRSNVALWPLNVIGEVGDISSAMLKISGLKEIPNIDANQIGALLEALMHSDKPIIFSELSIWPFVLVHLWKTLWSEARKTFSASVAFLPQNTNRELHTWIYCVPHSKVHAWHETEFCRIKSNSDALSRGVIHLLDASDSTLELFLSESRIPITRPYQLKKLIRAADRYDKFVSDQSSQHALDLLRTLISINEKTVFLDTLKKNCVAVIQNRLAEQNLEFIQSLSNLDDKDQPFDMPISQLQDWFSQRLSLLSYKEIKIAILKLRETSACDWWQSGLKKAIQYKVIHYDHNWDSIFIKILIDIDTNLLIKNYIPKNLEDRLVSAFSKVVGSFDLKGLLEITKENSWAKLHAKCALVYYAIPQAFDEQLTFGSANTGLELLIMGFPGQEIVQEIIRRANKILINILSKRTSKEASLLSDIDVSNQSWLYLWSEHIQQGGGLWPLDRDQKELAKSLLDTLIDNSEIFVPGDLLLSLANDLVASVDEYSRRENLWDLFRADIKTILLSGVAKRVLHKTLVTRVSMPEPILCKAAVDLALSTNITAQAILNILSWNSSYITEQKARKLLRRTNWSEYASPIGGIISSKSWREIAKDIYSSYKSGNYNLRPAVSQVEHLLSKTQKFMLKNIESRDAIHSENLFSPQDLIPIIAEIGADLAPDRLDTLWVRANGDRKQLRSSPIPHDAWSYAVEQANRDGNLQSLVEVLINEFPNNEYLQAASSCLRRK